jgi:hypothetical protein
VKLKAKLQGGSLYGSSPLRHQRATWRPTPQEYVPDLLNNPERTISQPKPDILYGYAWEAFTLAQRQLLAPAIQDKDTKITVLSNEIDQCKTQGEKARTRSWEVLVFRYN